jgi:hypothetical protein
MASYVYLLYTQIAIVISSFALQDYTLLFCFVVKESFFVTYLGVWILLKIIIPIAMLPIILLVKIATSASSSYQQQKVTPSPAFVLTRWFQFIIECLCSCASRF